MGFDIFQKECEKLVKDYDIRLEKPPANIDADLAMPCFSLAKKMKKSPQEIAEEVGREIAKKNEFELIERVEVSEIQLYQEILLQLSEMGIEYAPDNVEVRFTRCKVLDKLEKHPEIANELETVGNMLLLANTAPRILWEAADMRYKWAIQTAEWRRQEKLQRELYAARTDLNNAQSEWESIRRQLENERDKKKRSEDTERQKKKGEKYRPAHPL